jgi:hypothetical protein
MHAERWTGVAFTVGSSSSPAHVPARAAHPLRIQLKGGGDRKSTWAETASPFSTRWRRMSRLYNLSLLTGSSGTPSVTCDLRVTTGPSPSDRARSVSAIHGHRLIGVASLSAMWVRLGPKRLSTTSESVICKTFCPASSFTTTKSRRPHRAFRHRIHRLSRTTVIKARRQQITIPSQNVVLSLGGRLLFPGTGGRSPSCFCMYPPHRSR